MARRLCDQLGIWEDLAAKGIVDADPFVVDNDKHRYNNLGLPMNFSWQVSSLIADSLDKIFKQKTAIEWEKELSSKGTLKPKETYCLFRKHIRERGRVGKWVVLQKKGKEKREK